MSKLGGGSCGAEAACAHTDPLAQHMASQAGHTHVMRNHNRMHTPLQQ